MTRPYTLRNAEIQQARAPATFHIPSRRARQTLRVGEYAQLIFVRTQPPSTKDRGFARAEAERMWVRVIAVTGPGRYRGVLANTPSFLPVALGTLVPFAAHHVINIEPACN